MSTPDFDWDAVRAHYQEHRSYKATAEHFGLTVATVKKRAQRGRWSDVSATPVDGEETTLAIEGKTTADVVPFQATEATIEGAEARVAVPSEETSGVDLLASGGTEAAPVLPPIPRTGVLDIPAIPDVIHGWSKLACAHFYHRVLGWAVHPLAAPDKGDFKEQGKKPLLKGWRDHRAADVTPDDLDKVFGHGTSCNLGVVMRPPFVAVDLDSKPDAGASVRAWIADRPELAGVPRERTGGGAHLHFRCPDLPRSVLEARRPLTSQLTGEVGAELYANGHNLVVAPSIHRTGHHYLWEVTGEIPKVGWKDLSQWFGFQAAETKKPGRPPKEKPWWSRWREDLRTLDLVKIMGDLKMLGECLDPDAAKWSVRCPWESDHSGGAAPAPGSDTVIFNPPDTMPAFRCLHAHCDERSGKELLEWIEERSPGSVASHCVAMRVWAPGNKGAGGRPEIILPGTGRSASEFGRELGQIISPKLDLFLFSRNVVEIVEIEAVNTDGAIPGHMISTLSSAALVTAVERTVETGVLHEDEAGDVEFLPKSMSEHDARITLACHPFCDTLPRIARVLDVPVPLLDEGGSLVYPTTGYDPRFRTWLSPFAPKLRTMGPEEAVGLLLGELFATPDRGGFWWHDEQARLHALARLVTPFCRGLMGWQRAPLWIYDGNREGCGKDTCADVTHVLYTGRSIICAPLSKDCDEEMRKRITSALLAGARFFHLANMKGHVRYASLEAATDNSGSWEDRRLGVSETLVLPNETEFSFSANNATWEPDIERRCRRIRLRFTPEDINGHRYRHANLREWIRAKRGDLLSAINALVGHWVRHGCPPGPTPFTSFTEWGRVVGGILTSCQLGDPCLPHEDSQTSGDQNTRAMQDFFELVHARFGNQRLSKGEFQQFIQETEPVQELFDWIDFSSRKGLISFGKLLGRFDGRELRGILLTVDRSSKNRGFYQFSKIDPGTLPPPPPGQLMGTSGRGCGGNGGNDDHGYRAREKSETDFESRSDLKRPLETTGRTSPTSPTSPPPVFCTSKSDLDRIVDDLTLSSTGRIALDLETYGNRKGDGLDPWRGEIRLLTVCREGGPVWMIDLMAIGYDLGPLADILTVATVIAHNAKFDLLWLRVKCGLRLPKVFCTLTAARLLAAGTKPGNNLDQCLERYLGIEPGTDQSRSDWGSMLLTEEPFAYAARDIAHLHDLAKALETGIGEAALERVWTLESALLPRVVEMEAAGIRVDVERLRKIATNAQAAAAKASTDLRDALGNPGLNPASPAQLLAALRSKGITLDSTAEETLKAADDGRIIPLILAHREASKRAQQAETLIEHVKTDGRIHARFEPTGTATGRFSSKEPNLQNVGRGELREAFVPAPGHRFIVADYSQVELRAAAAIAGETKMIEAYRAGQDLHKLTASTVLGGDPASISKQQRQTAKAVSFGLLYGQSAPGLVRYAASSYGVTLQDDQAKEIRTAFFRTYGHLRQWHGESHKQAEEGVTEVRTRMGRRRIIPGTATEWERFTALVNTPVQGGCADGMKQAIVTLAERLPNTARILSTVHDEVIVEVPEAEAEQICDLVATAMKEAMESLFPEVPIEVEGGVCEHWGEKG